MSWSGLLSLTIVFMSAKKRAVCLMLGELREGLNVQRVHVRIIKIWTESFIHFKQQRLLILADEAGDRIAATIPHSLLESYPSLMENQWMFLENFHVTTNPGTRKWTEHDFHIVFNEKTVFNRTGSKRSGNIDFYKSIPYIQNPVNFFKTSMVDVIGAIVKVNRLEVKYYESHESLTRVPRDELQFTISDIDGNSIVCYARGLFARRFESLWVAASKNVVHVCVLKFADLKWHRVSFLDEICLCAEHAYTELLIDPPTTGPTCFQALVAYHDSLIGNIVDGYATEIEESD